MFDSPFDLIMRVLDIYRDIDRKAARFQSVTGLQCPERCGSCCESEEVEATVIEMLPLAEELLSEYEISTLLDQIEAKINYGDPTCALVHRINDATGYLRCSHYPHRPLMCRLFGCAARKGRSGKKELSVCRIIKQGNSSSLIRAEIFLNQGLDIPVYQECFMRIASLHPGMGFTLLPINIALKAALEYFYFRRPMGRTRYPKAA